MKKLLRCLALIAALCVGWSANAQLDEFVFSTGIDANKWITLTDYTDVSGTESGDSWHSSVLNIGFNFPFGGTVYTQYSVNSDGNLRLGSTVTGTANYSTPFSSTNANTNNPKINFFGCDGFLVSGTHYVHSQNFGDSLLVVEYCLGPFNSTYRNNQFQWQVHLYSNGKVEAVFASASNLNSGNSHQMGMCTSATDGWIINNSGVASYFTNGSSTNWTSSTWPTPNTYFSFEIPVVTCPRPEWLTVSNITSTSATFTFSPAGNESVWIGTITDGNTTLSMPLTDTVLTLPMLTPNTEYTVSVRALCGVGDTSSARTTTFHTPCVPLTAADLPYTENFEAYGTGTTEQISYCWTKGTNGTTAYPYPSSSAAINGTRGLYFYGYKPSSATSARIYSYAALPELAPSVNASGLTLRFNAKRYSTTTVYYRSLIVVGVMTDPTDITTFDTVEVINLTPLPASTVSNIEVDLMNYTGNGKHIALYVPYIDTATSYSYNYVYVDDVELFTTPTCFHPNELAASNITATSATITFTPSSNETSWLATITPAIIGNSPMILNSPIANLTNLTPNTEYTVSVRAICSVGDTSEAWSTTFRTACAALTSADLPYTEDFESYGSGSSYPIDPCWTKGTNGSTAYPYPYSSAAINGTRGLYFYGYKPSSATGTNIYSYAALPELASSVDVSGLTLRFNAKRYSSTSATYRSLLMVGVMTDPTDITTFDTVSTINLTPLPASTVVNYEIDLSSYTGNGKYVTFFVPYVDTNTSYSYNYVYVDDVELMTTPTCHRPYPASIMNVTNTSATLHWNGYYPSHTNFVVAYGRGTDPNLMTTVEVNDTIVTLTGLTESRAYNVFVKTICAPFDESDWSYMSSFVTLQTPIVVNTANPFFDNFEGDRDWMTANSNNNKWFVGTATNNGGEHALYISNNNGVSNEYSVSGIQWSYAMTDLALAAGDYVVNFDWKANGEGNYDYLRAFLVPDTVTLTGNVSPNGETPYNFRSSTPTGWISLDGSSKMNLQTSWQHRTDTATITTAGNYNLVFLWTNDVSGGSQPPAAVDNVKVQYLPANATTVILANANPTMGYTIPEPGNYYFAAGDTMRATAMPYYGYEFEYWELNAGLIRDSITINPIAQAVPAYLANMTFNATAHFNPRMFTITVASNNTLLGTVTGSGTYTYLDTITITATPNSGFRFLRWSDGNTDMTRTIVVTNDSSFTAIFDYQPVTVTLSVANPSMGTTVPAPGTYTFSVGDTMRATAIPNQYHRFVSWTLSAMGMSETVTMNPVSEVVPLFLAGMSFNITCNFEEYHLPVFDSIYDFEDSTADSSWTLINGTVANQWVIDNAISNGGNRSLYISNDGGVTNAYTISSVSFSYASIGGWMEPGIYNISYDWKANGENNYDYLRAFLAPIDYVFTAGQTPIGTTSANGFINTVPDGLIPLDGGTKKNLSSSFTTYNNVGVAITTPGEYKIVFMWANDISGGSQPPAAVDNITVTMPSCPAPAALAATDITANSATLSWFAIPGVTNYTVEYGYDTTAATMALVSGSNTLLAGLIDNTTYYFRVLYTCDSNEVASNWYEFKTLCSPIAPAMLPYSENFDSYTTSTTAATGIEPDCWTLAHRDVSITSNTYLPQIYYSTSNAHSGSYSLRLYYRCIYAMPAIDTNISALQMGFWVKQTSTNYQLVVGVMSDLSDETSFVAIDTIRNSSTSNIEYHEVNFANYTGNGHYIAFRNITPASYNYSYNYIDDIVVDLIPTCPAPTGVTAELLNATSATISWTPFDSTQNNFEVAYGTGTNPDSMLFASSNTPSVTITGLTPETNYNIYVLAICSPADVSPWSIPTSLYTGYCQPTPTSIDAQGITNVTFGTGDEIVNNNQRPTSAPYYGDYHTQVGGYLPGDSANVAITYATGYTYGTIIWVDWNNNLTFDGNEVMYVGTAPNNNPTTLNASFLIPETQDTGVYRMRIAGADSYYDSYTGSIAAAANANPCPSGSYTIVHDYSLHVMSAPAFDCGTTCQITIAGEDSYGDGWNGNTIVISQNDSVLGTFTLDNGSTYTATASVCSNYPVVFTWIEGSYSDEVSFTIYDGGGAPVYTCADGSALTDSMAFFTLNSACPTCLIPSVTVDSATTNSVTISWTDGNSGATYTIYNDNTAVDSGITANSYTFTGLTPNTDYTFGVQANCSATDASSIVYVNAHTDVEAITCGDGPATIVANADAATGTTGYYPGYCLYNYSYNEVIIPADRLTGLGEIKGMQFKPTAVANGSSFFNNCEIYMMNTTATSLSGGFIQDTMGFQLVFSGSLNYTDTTWQTVTFNNSFTWNGTDNVVVAVRRNHGSWASTVYFESFTADSALARHVYRDASAYTIGEITGGTAVTNVPLYHFIGCPAEVGCGTTCQITIAGEDSYGDGWNGGTISVIQNDSTISTFTLSDGDTASATISVCSNYPVAFSWTSGQYDSEVSFTIQDGSSSTTYTCSDGSSLPDTVFYTMNVPCPSCLIPSVSVTSLSTTSATISWTDNNSGATYTVYNNNTVVATGITANTYTFTGLTENTNYTFGVVANCSASDASEMATITVHTPCVAIAVPFYESFDTASVTLNCWTAYSMNTANSVSLSLFNGDGIALRFSSYNSASDYNQYAFSPVFNYTGTESTLNLSVQYATYGSSDHLWFGYITPTDTVWSTNYYTTSGQSDVQTYTTNIPSSATQIAFHYWGSYAYYAWIDSLSVTVGASCLPVTALTVDSIGTHSASISWTGDGSSYTIYNDTTVVATGITATNYTITGLTASTDYTFGVESYCPYGSPASIVYVNAHTLAEPIMCDSIPASIFANADSATSTVNYFPAYSLYDYSYSEVIIPSERLTGLGEIKGMEFKPTNVAAGSSHMTNCDIYLMHTTATSLSDGFIQDTTNFQLVFSGNLSYDNTNWQTITFDSSFIWNGFDNILVAVHRNDGSWASSGSFESFTASSQLARYVYRDNTPYTIGEITGGTATTNVPVYHLIGCEGQAPAGVTVNLAVNDTVMGTTVPAPGTYTFFAGDTMGAYAIANTGYHFDYWTVSVLGLTDTLTTNPIADIVPAYLAGTTFDINAYFAPNMYTITATSANTTMGTVTGGGSYAYGTTATLTATPATGYHFVQWNDADTHATRTVTVTGNATYTATFAPNTYTITVLANNALLGTTTGSGSYTYGATATISATPAANCHFVQWNDADTHATRTVTVTGDATYTATFAYNPLTVTLAVNDTAMGTTNPTPGTYTYNVGDTVIVSAVAATGHSFQTWVIPGVTLPDLTANPISVIVPPTMAGLSISATAQFAINSYTINVVANDSTRGSVTGSGTYTYGTEITITATPAQHNYLLQWSDGDTNLTRTITVTHDATYTAIFRALPHHTVTLNASVGGTVTGSGVYYEDDVVTISATPNEYYAFVNWVDPNNNVVYTEPTITFPMGTTDIVLTAVFEQVIFEATLDVTINNIEWGHVLINGERADRYHGHTGDTVTLVAVAHDGYHFDHWDGVHPANDTVAGEAISIVLVDLSTDVLCFFAENIGINDVVEDNTVIYTKNNDIVVRGAEQQTIRVFDVVGRLIAQRSNAAVEETIPMPATGVYLVKVGDRPARRVVVRK